MACTRFNGHCCLSHICTDVVPGLLLCIKHHWHCLAWDSRSASIPGHQTKFLHIAFHSDHAHMTFVNFIYNAMSSFTGSITLIPIKIYPWCALHSSYLPWKGFKLASASLIRQPFITLSYTLHWIACGCMANFLACNG